MGKRVINSRSQFSLEIDLVDTFGSELPEGEVLAFGQAVIDTILDRTADNKGSDGDRFDDYSNEYAESLPFLAAGKSQSNPNLDLTGQMLLDMDIIEASSRKLRIGFRDTLQRDKAWNHHTGDTVPARPFLDLTDSEFNELIEEFRPEENIEDETLSISPEIFGVSTQQSTTVSLLELLGDSDLFGDQ